MVQKNVIYLLGGLSPWEGGKTGCGATEGEPFGRPQGLGGGA